MPPPALCVKRRPAAGFTLVELAVALTVVGLLLAMLTPSLGERIERLRLAETRQALADAQEALLGFAVANGRLPRPATSFADGTESAAPCASDAACTGFLPWQTLGVRNTDGWQKLLRYSVTPAFANAPFTLTGSGSKKILSRDAAGNQSYLVGSASACSTGSPCAAAVVHSAGKNNWGTLADGGSVGDFSTTNADEDANENASTRFFARPPGTVPGGGEFDDVVVWLPTTILINRLVAAGRLP